MIVDVTDELGNTHTVYLGPDFMNVDPAKVIQIKAGSAAVFTITCRDSQDPPQVVDLTGYEIFIDFLDPRTRKPLAEVSIGNGINLTDITNGTYTVNAGDTTDWALGYMFVDIKYVNGGVAQMTETFYLNIIRGNTR